jgi:hypothetical protein
VGACPAYGESEFSGWKGVAEAAPAAREIVLEVGAQELKITTTRMSTLAWRRAMGRILQQSGGPAHPACWSVTFILALWMGGCSKSLRRGK